MVIEVDLMAGLKDLLPEKREEASFKAPVRDETTISGLFEELGLPHDLDVVIIVNGHYVREDYRLQDGDRVSVFPPIQGG